MQLASHTISSKPDRPLLLNVQFSNSTPHQFDIQATSKARSSLKHSDDDDHQRRRRQLVPNIFASPTTQGFLVAHDSPLNVVARRVFPPFHSTLSQVHPVDSSSLLILVGGGTAPRWSPNKVILWDQDAATATQSQNKDLETSTNLDTQQQGIDLNSQKGSTIFDATSRFGQESEGGDDESSNPNPRMNSRFVDRKGKGKARDQDRDSESMLESEPNTIGKQEFERIREWQKDQKEIESTSALTSLQDTLSKSASSSSILRSESSNSLNLSSDSDSDPGVGRSSKPNQDQEVEEEEDSIEMIPDEELSEMRIFSKDSDSEINKINERFDLEKSNLSIVSHGSDEDSGQLNPPRSESTSITNSMLDFQPNPSSIPLPVGSTASLYDSTSQLEPSSEAKSAIAREGLSESNLSSSRNKDFLSRSFSIESSSAGLDDPFSTVDEGGNDYVEEDEEGDGQVERFKEVETIEPVFHSEEGLKSSADPSDVAKVRTSPEDEGSNTNKSFRSTKSVEQLQDGKPLNSSILTDQIRSSYRQAGTDNQVNPSPNLKESKDVLLKSSSTSKTTSRASKAQDGIQDQDSQKTSTRKPNEIRGRSVAELEFGETVRGICVRRFQWKEKLRTTIVDEKRNDLSAEGYKTIDRTILASILDSKVVVFEMGQGVGKRLVAEGEETWGIIQRAVVEIWDGKINYASSSSSSRDQSKGMGQKEKVGRSKIDSGLASISPMKNFSTRPSSRGSNQSKVITTHGALLAILGRQVGHVQLIELPLITSDPSSISSTSKSNSTKGASTIIAAHSSPIISLTLSENGSKLLTASERGTVLRIWSTGVGENQSKPSFSSSSSGAKAVLLNELRRGTDPARILSMKFSPDERFVAVASDKGTIHFFRLKSSGSDQSMADHSSRSNSTSTKGSSSSPGGNTPPLFNSASKFLPSKINKLASNLHSSIPSNLLPTYFNSTWSDCQFRIPLKTFLSERSSNSPSELFSSSSPSRVSFNDGYSESSSHQHQEETFSKDNFLNNKTTEGSWANMRGRIKDLRKGEIGIDEKVWLNWCRSEIGRNLEVEDERSSSEKKDRKSTSEEETEEFHLIAITSSGGWYRISIDSEKKQNLEQEKRSSDTRKRNASSSSHSSTGSVVLDMYREDTASASSSSPKESSAERRKEKERKDGGCTLVEYRKIGELDGW